MEASEAFLRWVGEIGWGSIKFYISTRIYGLFEKHFLVTKEMLYIYLILKIDAAIKHGRVSHILGVERQTEGLSGSRYFLILTVASTDLGL